MALESQGLAALWLLQTEFSELFSSSEEMSGSLWVPFPDAAWKPAPGSELRPTASACPLSVQHDLLSENLSSTFYPPVLVKYSRNAAPHQSTGAQSHPELTSLSLSPGSSKGHRCPVSLNIRTKSCLSKCVGWGSAPWRSPPLGHHFPNWSICMGSQHCKSTSWLLCALPGSGAWLNP